jgi:hypothetical protein
MWPHHRAYNCSPRVVRRSVASQTLSPATDAPGRLALRLAQRDLGSVVGMRDRALGEAQTNRTLALSLAQLVILAVIPPDPTAADQTTLHGMPCQPELPGPYWSGLSGRLAVIS